MKKLMLVLIVSLFLISCTDAYWDASFGKLGVPATIECYSGTKLIYKGKSTGAIESPQASDGYQFREQGTDNFMEVSGNCIMTYDD